MSFSRKKYLVVLVILFIAVLFMIKIERTKGRVSSGIDLSKFPLVIGEWKGEDLEISERVYEILETKDVMIRRYKDSQGAFLTLTVVYSGQKRHTFHPPEICYLGGGVELIKKSQDKIALKNTAYLKINKLLMSSPRGQTKAWYWFLAGVKFVPNFYLQQAYLIIDIFKGGNLQGALIKVSVIGDSPVLENKAKSFIKEIVPYLNRMFIANQKRRKL